MKNIPRCEICREEVPKETSKGVRLIPSKRARLLTCGKSACRSELKLRQMKESITTKTHCPYCQDEIPLRYPCGIKKTPAILANIKYCGKISCKQQHLESRPRKAKPIKTKRPVKVVEIKEPEAADYFIMGRSKDYRAAL